MKLEEDKKPLPCESIPKDAEQLLFGGGRYPIKIWDCHGRNLLYDSENPPEEKNDPNYR
jgi:hypothetical protein